jgi:hypothetical protein
MEQKRYVCRRFSEGMDPASGWVPNVDGFGSWDDLNAARATAPIKARVNGCEVVLVDLYTDPPAIVARYDAAGAAKPTDRVDATTPTNLIPFRGLPPEEDRDFGFPIFAALERTRLLKEGYAVTAEIDAVLARLEIVPPTRACRQPLWDELERLCEIQGRRCR